MERKTQADIPVASTSGYAFFTKKPRASQFEVLCIKQTPSHVGQYYILACGVISYYTAMLPARGPAAIPLHTFHHSGVPSPRVASSPLPQHGFVCLRDLGPVHKCCGCCRRAIFRSPWPGNSKMVYLILWKFAVYWL